MQTVHLILMAATTLLLVLEVARWRVLPPADPERVPRRDAAALLGLCLVGLGADAVRARVPENSPAYVAISVGLIPVTAAALYLLVRLIGAFRRTRGTADERRDNPGRWNE